MILLSMVIPIVRDVVCCALSSRGGGEEAGACKRDAKKSHLPNYSREEIFFVFLEKGHYAFLFFKERQAVHLYCS